ncbi:DUF1266 domain-containing protein [Nonomuraea sp. NPDC046802]|uniref:DUF1266 domain-containing protein n=1 Tax=Nonomuraea sp. NPDC046802 TaxID=3154919 RepID=UPI0033D8DD02
MGMPIRNVPGQGPAWVPPTDVERALFDARARGDWDAYIMVLMGAGTFSYKPKDLVDRRKLVVNWLTEKNPEGKDSLVVYTRGELPRRRHDAVACAVSLPFPPEEWWGSELQGLLVNPGSPSGAYFPDAKRSRRHWKSLKKNVPKKGHDADQLLTKYTGALHGPVAHGLACGAHLAVHNGVIWNEIGDVYLNYQDDVETLREAWGVTDRSNWQVQVMALLEGRNSPSEPELLLRLRDELARQYPGSHRDPSVWQQAAADAFAQQGLGQEGIAFLIGLIGKISRYEERFRADGILPPDGYVTSAFGYDFGRAVNFARWGLSARLAEPAEVEQVVIKAGELARQVYRTWEEYSAGYILGRVLRFDEESFGHMYDSALTPHRVLTRDPASPWRNIPFTG